MPIDLACTGCRRRLSVRDEFAGRQVRCPGCGAMVLAALPVLPASAPILPGYEGPFFTPPAVVPPPTTGPAWTAVLFSPSAFFANRGARSTVREAVKVGLPFLLVGAAATTVQTWLILRRVGPWLADAWTSGGLGKPPFDAAPSFLSVAQSQLVMEVFSVVLLPLALHAGLRMVGANGLRRTLSIYFYSLSARVLDLLPFGFLLSMIYVLVLNYLGARHVHRLSEGKSLGAILLAVVIGVIGLLIPLSIFTLLHDIPLPTPR